MCRRSQSDITWYYLDLGELDSIVKGKSLIIAQIYIYVTCTSSSISPLSNNPFISQIVLTTVTGRSLRIQKCYFPLEMITLTKFWSESYIEPPREDYLFLNTVFIFELNWEPYKLTYKFSYKCTYAFKTTLFFYTYTHLDTYTPGSIILSLTSKHINTCILMPELQAVENLLLSWGDCGRDTVILRGCHRVNIGGWMRQSALFTYHRRREKLGTISWVTTSAEIKLEVVLWAPWNI